MRKILIGLAALAALASSVAPSGAGQHFGVAGDLIAFPVTANSTFGPVQSAVEGFFAWGLSATVSDTASGPAARADTFTGCLTIATPQGEDRGCIHDFRLPPSLSDPAMRQVKVEGAMPSDRQPGSMIAFSLTFDAAAAPAPGRGASTSTDSGHLLISVRAGLSTIVSVRGVVTSGIAGTAPIESTGLYARGASIDVCTYDQQPCPYPGSNG